jgi:hypothetical protein
LPIGSAMAIPSKRFYPQARRQAVTLSQATLDKLAKFDTPSICNFIELFDVRPRNRGYMDHRVKSNFPELPPCVGYACTASFRSDAPPAGGDAYGNIGDQLEQVA